MNQKVLSILILAEMLTASPTAFAQSCNSNIRATTPVSRFVIDAKKAPC